MIWTFGKLKGGVGASTSCAYVGSSLTALGHKVVALDADEEQTLINWSLDGGLSFPVLEAQRDRICRQAKALTNSYEVVLIDLPPNRRDLFVSSALCSKLFLVCTTASAVDINRLEPSLDILADLEEQLDRDFVHILVTKYARTQKLAKEFEQEFLAYPVLTHKISNRVKYQQEFGETPSYLTEYISLTRELLALCR